MQTAVFRSCSVLGTVVQWLATSQWLVEAVGVYTLSQGDSVNPPSPTKGTPLPSVCTHGIKGPRKQHVYIPAAAGIDLTSLSLSSRVPAAAGIDLTSLSLSSSTYG